MEEMLLFLSSIKSGEVRKNSCEDAGRLMPEKMGMTNEIMQISDEDKETEDDD